MKKFSSIIKEKKIPWVRHWIDATFEFSKEFTKPGTDEIDFEALGREEYEFRKALMTKDFSNNERARYVFEEAMQEHSRRSDNGSKGGRPKNKNKQPKDENESQEQEQKKSPSKKKTSNIINLDDKVKNKKSRKPVKFNPPDVSEVYDYAQDKGLDESDARDCYEMCSERQWADRDGVLIVDWKGFVYGFCKSRENKRKTS